MALFDINVDLAVTVEADSAEEALVKIKDAVARLPLCGDDIYHPRVTETIFCEERDDGDGGARGEG